MAAFGFSYRIYREYPYNWFPWITVIGGTLLTILISVFSVATSGYYLENTNSADPNVTTAKQDWFGRPPFSWTEHVSSRCQPSELQVGAVLFTKKLWQQFTITGVKIFTGTEYDVNTPAFMYSNNVLEKCSIEGINLQLATNLSVTSVGQIPGSPSTVSPIYLEASLNCSLTLPEPTVIRMAISRGRSEVSYAKPPLAYKLASGPKPEDGEVSSLVFAELLSGLYLTILETEQESNTYPELVPGFYMMIPRAMDTSNLLVAQRSTVQRLNGTKSSLLDLIPQVLELPVALDRIVKLFYAALLVDLGHPETTIFNKPDLLLNWTDDAMLTSKAVVDIVGGYGPVISSFLYGTANLTETWRGTISSKLNTNRTTIYTQYQCQSDMDNIQLGSDVVAAKS